VDVQAQRKRLIEGNRGITAFMKLLRQLAIIDERIHGHMERMSLSGHGLGSDNLSDVLVLDTETFYTVAQDALDVAGLFLTQTELKALRRDPAFKMICNIRSHRVRHAYNKPDGNPYSGYGYGPAYGPILKAGSDGVKDEGYLQHSAAFWSLLERHGILLPTSPSQPIVAPDLMERFIGRAPF